MTPQRFVAHVSRWRTGLLAALALGFIALSGWFLTFPDTPDRVIGSAGVIVFGLAGLASGRQLLRTRPVLEIDRGGIMWRRWSDTPIPWAAIKRIELRAMQRQSFLCLWLDDPAAYPSTRPLGWLARANRALGFGDIAVSAAGLDHSVQDVADAVARCSSRPHAIAGG